jgi:hypothetical protein
MNETQNHPSILLSRGFIGMVFLEEGGLTTICEMC